MWKHSIARKINKNRPGVAALEFAVVLPVILILLLGCVDFGRAMHWSIAVSNATATGAHYGATRRRTPLTQDQWETSVGNVVVEELEGHRSFSPADFETNVNVQVEADGNQLVTVTSTYQFPLIVNWPGISDNGIPISSTVTFRQLH